MCPPDQNPVIDAYELLRAAAPELGVVIVPASYRGCLVIEDAVNQRFAVTARSEGNLRWLALTPITEKARLQDFAQAEREARALPSLNASELASIPLDDLLAYCD
jgi:hypothetical protein